MTDEDAIRTMIGPATFLNVTTIPRDGTAPTRRGGRTLSILDQQSDGWWLLIRDANMLTVD
jgi:ketosteroid isomerase-like protein